MLKIAIVGTGIIVKQHLNAIEHLDDVELVAVCDINEEKARAIAEERNKLNVIKLINTYEM